MANREGLWSKKWIRVIFWSWISLTCIAISLGILLIDLMTDGPLSQSIVPHLELVLPSKLDDPDFKKSAEQFARDQGYSFEAHDVETEDGYIIEMHRLYDPQTSILRPPVLVGLGLLTASTASLFEKDNHTNAYLFASAGFDVWLLNTRGSPFGSRHRFLDPVKNRTKFYDFSVLEVGSYDFAAQIDYVISATGYPQVFAALVSQSVMTMMALLTKRPLYNTKVRAMVSFGGLRGGCFSYSGVADMIQLAAWPSDVVAWSTSAGPVLLGFPESFKFICARTGDLCANLVLAACFTKYDTYLNKTRFPIYLEHVPAGTSYRNLVYLSQLRPNNCDGSVRDFDYDHGPLRKVLIRLGLMESRNLKIYGSLKPPLLNAKNIRVPIKLYYSVRDNLATKKENLYMASDIGIPPWDVHEINDERFEHLNFIFNFAQHGHVYHAINFFNSFKNAKRTFHKEKSHHRWQNSDWKSIS